MDPAEVEFLASAYPVTVVPNFSHDALYLISGDAGPFVAGLPLTVPLWLAVHLRQRHQCRLVAPDWMEVDTLEGFRRAEAEARTFQPAPCQHYAEVAHLLLDAVAGAEDLPRADEMRALVKDLWDLRAAKLRSSVDSFVRSDEVHATLDGLTPMEINNVRNVLTQGLDSLHNMRRVRFDTLQSAPRGQVAEQSTNAKLGQSMD